MKPKSIKSLMLLAMLAPTSVFGQTTAKTDPVGYDTTTIYGAFSAGVRKNNVIAPDLQNAESWAGTIASISGDTITLTNAALTPATYNKNGVTLRYVYFLETSDGYWAQIESNDATSVTVQTGAGGANFTAAEKVSIRRHVTIADYFGAANETDLLDDPGGDASVADNIVVIDEQFGGTVTIFASNVIGGTWVTDGLEEAGNFPIYPNQGLQVQRLELGNKSLVRSGEVNTTGRQIQIKTGINVRPDVIPVDTTLGALALYTGSNATGVVPSGSGDTSEADIVTVLVNGNPSNYFYSTIDLDGSGPGWYDDGLAFAHNTVLPAGAGLIINRANPTLNAPFIWTAPAPTIAP